MKAPSDPADHRTPKQDGPLTRRLCRTALVALIVLYALAVLALMAGTFGLFRAEPDPISGVFLLPLGVPWNWIIDAFPEPAWPWLAVAAPIVNIILVWLICNRSSRAGRR